MRPRTIALVSILVAVGALAVVLFFASRDDSARNDALLFLDRYDGIDVDDPLEERRERIEQLSRLRSRTTRSTGCVTSASRRTSS